jgi:hypothetical protein
VVFLANKRFLKSINKSSRMSFSCPSQTSLTDSEVDQQFGSGTVPGLLSLSPKGGSDREGNGMLKATAVNGIIVTLKNSGIIPSPDTKNVEVFLNKQKELIKNTQDEYCFYYSRYRYVLEKLLSVIRQGYMNNTADTQRAVQKYLVLTQGLNQKLNDLVQITNGVSEEMLKSNTGLEQQIKAFDQKIKEQQQKLLEQNKIIMSNDAVTKLNKQMVKYTEEKGRYTDNLLKVYSVLNVVALGLLVYIYKSAD